MAAVSLLKSHLFYFHLETVYISCEHLILLWLNFHIMGSIGVNIYVTKFQIKDVSNIIPALASLKCLIDKVVDEAS